MNHPFTETEAAVLMKSALQVVCVLDTACIEDKPWSAPLPAGLLSCGEAITLIPALAFVLAELYPSLVVPEYLHEAVTLAQLEDTEGEA